MPQPTSWAGEVQADSSQTWSGNQIRFATAQEASAYVADLAMRWTAVRSYRTVPSDDPVTHRLVGRDITPVGSDHVVHEL